MSPADRQPVPCRGPESPGQEASATRCLPFPGRVLGLDLGSRRIGVAASDSGQTLAVGVDTVMRSTDLGRDRRRVAHLVSEYEAVGLVVGLPLSLDGGEGPAAIAALAEVAALGDALDVPVVTVDARRQRGVVDRTAAAIILQTWLDRTSNENADG